MDRLVGILAALSLLAGCADSPDPELLSQHRNLGKAFYENPATQQESVAEFQKALELNPDSARERLNYGLALLRAGSEDDGAEQLRQVQQQDPALPHSWFNLGLHYAQLGEFELALAQFEGFVERAPDEPIGHYQLATLYQQFDRTEDARREYERASELDPLLAAAHFRLASIYRSAGDAEQSRRHLEEFQRLQQLQADWVTPEDVKWSDYAEIYDPPEQRLAAPEPAEPAFAETALPGTISGETAGLAVIDLTGQGRTDLLAWSASGILIYEQGRTPVPGAGLESLTNVLHVSPGDFDDDGLADLCVTTTAGVQLYRNNGGNFALHEAALPSGVFRTAVWLDYDHDYDLDLVLLGADAALVRNQGPAGWEDRSQEFPFVEADAMHAVKLRVRPDSTAFDLAVAYQSRETVLYRDLLGGRYEAQSYTGDALAAARQVDADFDADGDLDRARVEGSAVQLLTHPGDPGRNWIRVRLTGVRSVKLAEDALVEVKIGQLYRQAFYRGVPLLFDVADAAKVDVVRITWPNGLIQNEINQPVNQEYAYEEAQRLSGSCPMIWTWNGSKFQFITDVLGVAPLGASDGEGSYFPVDHDEYIQIPGEALQPRDGKYEIRITEELSEVAYLDQIELYAVDHPAGVHVFTSDKFKGPPFPEFRLFAVDQPIYPSRAGDHRGNDVLDRINRRDQRYPDSFTRSYRGIAEQHHLELDFAGAPADAVLFLNGWVDWPDGSTFRAVSQGAQPGPVVPYLQAQDESGAWITIDAEMGMPAGKPKTISVPVSFPSASRKLRVVTNLCVYWDEIFLGVDAGSERYLQRAARPAAADVHFRGFSKSIIHPQRKQPDTFVYETSSPTSYWNPTAGLYTRYGDVATLLKRADDQFVIIGSGDEVTLSFDAASLPAPQPGWVRDFLLKVDGWAKDHDPNTAYSSSVEPLPFHEMSAYPYASNEDYPRDAAHEDYRNRYNTRPALVLIRPLDAPREER